MMEWIESHNCYKLNLGAIVVNVNWNGTADKGTETGYEVSVQCAYKTRKLKGLYQTAREGKIAGFMLANKVLSEAQAKLEQSIILVEDE